MSNGDMNLLRLLIIATVLVLPACETVSTRVVELNPAQKYPPTQSVEVLLHKPTRAHTEIALIESRGDSEAELLNDAREKAKALGADAIVRLETERIYHEPVAVYDPWPWYDPFYWPYYRRPFPPFHPAWGPYRYVGGYFSYVLKAAAIRYDDKAASRQP